MKFSVLTLFPEMFPGVFDSSIIKRAINKHILDINYINIRDFATDRHHTVDDKPYGGGNGMLMKVDIIHKAIEKSKIKNQKSKIRERIILFDPKGKLFNQKTAKRLSKFEHLILVCGHYEGIDHRINKFVDEKISIGNYILTGGEIPAMIIIDSISRLIKGVLRAGSVDDESLPPFKLEYPQYTRPENYKNLKVPKVLLGGNHKKIEDWRIKKTKLSAGK